MSTRLVSYRGGKTDLAFPIQGPRVTFGREEDNMIQLPHANVSRHHAVIVQTPKGWAIEGLQSVNGVLVDGKRSACAELKDQDRVQVGPYEFYFETNVPSGRTSRPLPGKARPTSRTASSSPRPSLA